MGGYHQVSQGECLSSLAQQYGFADYHTIYDHPNNQEFRQKRPNPNIICPGDQIYIPERGTKAHSRPADNLHKFSVKRPKTLLRLVVQGEDGKPTSAEYRLVLPSGVVSGSTGSDGLIAHQIPPTLEKAILDVTIRRQSGEAISQRLTLKLGYLDPVEEPTGIQSRLNNLGFNCGEVDGIIGPKTEAAIRGFQEWGGLDVDGIAGPKTQVKLKGVHGC